MAGLSSPLGRPFSAAPPAVADGLVIVTGYYSSGGQKGEVEAFPQSCGAPLGLSCKPAWKAFVSTDDSMVGSVGENGPRGAAAAGGYAPTGPGSCTCRAGQV